MNEFSFILLPDSTRTLSPSSPLLQSLLIFLLQLCLACRATLVVAGATAGLSSAVRHLLKIQGDLMSGHREGIINDVPVDSNIERGRAVSICEL